MNESGERLSLKKIVLMRATKMEQVNLDHQIHQYRQIHQNNQIHKNHQLQQIQQIHQIPAKKG